MNNFKRNKRKNNFKNLLKKNLSFLLNSTRYRRNSKLNAVPYVVKNGPQRYGPGRNLSVINAVYSMDSNTIYRISLQSMLLNNNEFSTKKVFFRYFKVLEIRIVFPPSNQTSNIYHFLNFSWNSIEESDTDIQKDDSSKVVSYYRPRTRVVRWKPIRGVINVNSVLQEVPINFIDISQFISTDRIESLPGWLYISNANSTDWFMFEVVVEFRGNDFGDSPKSEKLHELEILMEKWKKNREENKKKEIIDLLPVNENHKGSNKEIIENIEEDEKEIEEEEVIENKRYDLLTNTDKGNQNLEPSNEEIIRKNNFKSDLKNIINKKKDVKISKNKEPILPRKFLKIEEEINTEKDRAKKVQIIDQPDNENQTINKAELINNPSSLKEKRKEIMLNKMKNLLDETSFDTELPFKNSEIT